MFASIGRSWRFAMTSYSILWRNKALLLFPILSTISATMVIASFVSPFLLSGTLRHWAMSLSDKQNLHDLPTEQKVGLAALAFLFYFANYLVIVFFNSALVAGAFQAIAGQPVSLSAALKTAGQRWPQILGWAALSAVIGTLLKSIENGHEKVGQLIAAVLGSGWTVMTYFVIPVIVVEGLGPIAAIKQSLSVLKQHWGTALIGNVSLGLLGFLLTMPLFLLAAGLVALGVAAGQPLAMGGCIAAAVAIGVLAVGISSSADMVFKALLFNFATGRALPAGISPEDLHDAFRSR
ncbi:MAG: DUF6159 family protein [Planctomycetia bacterium]|nr:DUF6159 family protein [Planctomycetia bacterium]